MFYVNKAHRWCYDEKFNLKSDQAERVRVNKVTSNVMTGIIESIGDSVENESGIYEKNLTHYSAFLPDEKMIKSIGRVADRFKINCNSLVATLIKELK